MKSYFILFVFVVIAQLLWSQQTQVIEGRIVAESSNSPVPFVNMFNKTLKKGTITNANGYFRLEFGTLNDSIIVSQIGYKSQVISLENKKSFYTISLEENSYEIEEVVLDPDKNSYLFEFVEKSKKNVSSASFDAKAYYELKSYKDSKQLELVEGYYNMKLGGYEIKDLSLKAGRLALQPYQNRLFTSQASSRAITMLKLMGSNDYFPESPFDIGKKEAKKSFHLALSQKYKNERNDSIYLISYWPKKNSGLGFEGDIWMNVTNFQIEKITMNCEKCAVHPFLPLFPDDSVSNVSLNITKTFTPFAGKMIFNHIDFSYGIDYKSRTRKNQKMDYSIKTNAVLYAYDFGNRFELPQFYFLDNVDDYRKINALPYNVFFWENNDEYRLNDEKNRNEAFFLDSNSITNVTFFKSRGWRALPMNEALNSNTKKQSGYFEHPYVRWSTNRIFLRELIPDSTTQSRLGDVKSLQYKLDVQIYADWNHYNDSTNILTATIFDPFTTYYYLPIDKYANCFINMYFDLCELERRNWEKERRKDLNQEEYKMGYVTFEILLKKQINLFLKEVERGTNRKAMEKWNAIITGQLGINNIELFQLYSEN